MTTQKNFADTINFADNSEAKGIQRRQEIFDEQEAAKKFRDARQRYEEANPYGEMNQVTSPVNCRSDMRNDQLPERIEIEPKPTKYPITEFEAIEADGVQEVSYQVGECYYQGKGATVQEAIIKSIENSSTVFFTHFRMPGMFRTKVPDIKEWKIINNNTVQVTAQYIATNQNERRVVCQFTSRSTNSNPDISFCEAVVEACAEVRSQVLIVRETR